MAYSSQGNRTDQLDFRNWLEVGIMRLEFRSNKSINVPLMLMGPVPALIHF